MRKLAPVAAIIALLASIAAISPLTTASAQQGETLRFSARNDTGQFHFVDVDDSGDESGGDYFVGNFILRRGGKNQGHLEFHCDFASISPTRTLCNGVARISGRGELVVSDVSAAEAEVQRVTITGGTGDFGGANGNGRFEFGRSRVQITFQIK